MGVGATVGGALGLSSILGGTGATIAGSALVGAGVGAAGSAITGGDPGEGALFGGITAGATSGLGGIVGGGLGIGTVAGDALVGAGTGALVNGLTGQNALSGALTGGASGLISGVTSPSGATPGATTSGGASAAGSAAPAGVAAASPVDLSSVNTDLSAGGSLGGTAATSGSSGFSSNLGSDLSFSGGGGLPASSGALGSTGGSVNIDPTSGLAVGGGSSLGTSPLASVGTGTAPLTAPSGDLAAGTALGSVDSTGSGGFSGLVNKALGYVEKNPGAAIGALGAGYNLLKGQQQPAGYNQLLAAANGLSQQGSQLSSYLQTGTLPAGVQNSINSATQAAKAHIRSQFASSGQSGSTAEQTALNQVDLNAAVSGEQIAQSLLTQGVNETGLSSGLYQALLNLNEQQNKDVSSSIAGFATALAGGGAKAA